MRFDRIICTKNQLTDGFKSLCLGLLLSVCVTAQTFAEQSAVVTRLTDFQTVCPTAKLKTANVSSVGSNAEILLDDGKVIRLADLHMPRDKTTGNFSKILMRFLRETLHKKQITYIETAPQNRYKSIPALIFMENQLTPFIQLALIDRGLSIFMPETHKKVSISKNCDVTTIANTLRFRGHHASLRLEEMPHKDAYIYAADNSILWRKEGDFAIVEGVVSNAQKTRRGGIINFGPDWKRDFTALLTFDVTSKLKSEGISLSKLAGQRIQVRGFLDLYNGPSMRIDHRMQVELLNQ